MPDIIQSKFDKYKQWALILLIFLTLFLIFIVWKNHLVVIQGSVMYIVLAFVGGIYVGYLLYHRKRIKDPYEIAQVLIKKDKYFNERGYILDKRDLEINDLSKTYGLSWILFYFPYARSVATKTIIPLTVAYDIEKEVIAAVLVKNLNMVLSELKEVLTMKNTSKDELKRQSQEKLDKLGYETL
jgi:hypothetical protein